MDVASSSDPVSDRTAPDPSGPPRTGRRGLLARTGPGRATSLPTITATVAASAAVVVCLALSAWLAVAVLRQIDGLSDSKSDNLQWSLSQAQVEFDRFRLALEQARHDPAAVTELRQTFNIFYARVSIVERGNVFRSMAGDPAFVGPRAEVRAFLDDNVDLFDGPDEELLAAVPDLIPRAEAVGEDVRAFSLAALQAFARLSDERRASVLRLLGWLAAVLMATIVALGMLAVSHFRLFRLAERRADEVETAGVRMRTIVQTSPHAIVVTDDVGRIREFNPAAERILGNDRAEALKRDIVDLLVPPSERARARLGPFAFLSEHRRPARGERNFEIDLQDNAGRRFAAELAIDRASADRPIYVAHIRDISRRKRAEEELMQARDQALAGERAKSEFLAVMSHEMRTPLNGLLGTIQLLNDHRMTERQAGLLARMKGSGELLLGLVNDVLDLAKYEAGMMKADRKPFSLERLMQGVVDTAAPMARSNGNALDWSWTGPAPTHALGDARRLRQVLLNLVGNAIKFTRNGSVELEAEYINATEVEFRVIDTGIGIAEADLERIFHDFETLDSSYAREAGGTGLGLGISRRLMRLMGGEIGAESGPGEGSLFWVRLPLEPVEARPGAGQTRDGAAGCEDKRLLDVLLVEDNEANRFIVREMLALEGHRVVEAENGRDGVETAALRRFDVIVMDVSMPVMDGTEATRRIRAGNQASCDVPILALTAHALPEELARFREAGMTACMSKPIDRDLLLQTLQELARGDLPDDTLDAGPSDTGADRLPRLPLLDEALLSVFLSRVPQDQAERLMARFLDETEAEVLALAEAGLAPADLGALAHRCAGSCGTYGAEAMRAALKRIVAGVKLDSPPDEAELAALVPLWRDTRAAITARLRDRMAEA